MLREFCAENFTLVPKAIEAGAARIELCDNLAVGGTTPSYGVIQTTVEYARLNQVDVMVIIRPRGGNFNYTKEEVKIMCRDLLMARQAGINGMVLGAVKDGWIDETVMDQLLALTLDTDVTFHMAFDAITPSLQFKAIDWLVSRGVKRILTHGGPAQSPIDHTLHRLKELVVYAGSRIMILPGGGVTYENAAMVAQTLSVNEVHGTRIVKL